MAAHRRLVISRSATTYHDKIRIVTSESSRRVPTNPFSSQAVTPGAIPFRFPHDVTTEKLVAKFQAAGERGQILGPHGTGKSTLLAELLPCLESQGYHTVSIALHDGQRQLPRDFLPANGTQGPLIIVVDGYEQLGRLARWHLRRRCQKNRWGLLVTTHQNVGLPTLITTQVTERLAGEIIEQLLQDRDFHVESSLVEELLAKNEGNLRDMLFDLYDRYERFR